MGWEDLAEAAYTLANPDVLWIATNTDQTIPKERGQAPGNGTLVAAVATASRRTPLVAGKPEAPIFHTAAKAVNSSRPVIVGDRLDTDILGANNAKMDGALVLTGVQTYQDVIEPCRTSVRPIFCAPSRTSSHPTPKLSALRRLRSHRNRPHLAGTSPR